MRLLKESTNPHMNHRDSSPLSRLSLDTFSPAAALAEVEGRRVSHCWFSVGEKQHFLTPLCANELKLCFYLLSANTFHCWLLKPQYCCSGRRDPSSRSQKYSQEPKIVPVNAELPPLWVIAAQKWGWFRLELFLSSYRKPRGRDSNKNIR